MTINQYGFDKFTPSFNSFLADRIVGNTFILQSQLLQINPAFYRILICIVRILIEY